MVFIGMLLSPLILIGISFFESQIGIPQQKTALFCNSLAILGLGWYFTIHKRALWSKKSTLEKDALIHMCKQWLPLIFLILIFARVFPVTYILTPITADSIAHAQWLRTLTTTGFVTQEQWYPQGLEYFLNYFTTFTLITTPKAVLLFSNYCAALFPIAVFYCILLTSEMNAKKRFLFALSGFVIASLTPYPKELFYTFGKNSFIFAFAMTPIILALAFRLKTYSDALLLSMLAFSIFVIHFPTSAFVYLLIASIFFSHIFIVKDARLTIQKSPLYKMFLFGFATATFIAIFAIHIAPLYTSHPPSEDKAMAQAAATITTPFSWIPTNLLASQKNIFEYKPCFTARFLTGSNICRPLHIDKDTFAIDIFALFLLGLIVYLFKRNESIINRVLVGYGAGYLLMYFFLLLPNKVPGFFLFAEYVLFFTFLFVIIAAWLLVSSAFFFEKRYPAKTLLIYILALGLLFLIGNAEAFKTYFDKQSKTSTQNADMQAFDFITANLPQDNKKILVELYNVDNKIIAGADSGIWIPSFTGRDIEVSWLDFSQDRSFVIYDLAKNLVANPDDAASLDTLFCTYHIGYLFHGSTNQRKSTIIVADNNPNYTLLYDRKAKLYKIIDRKCK